MGEVKPDEDDIFQVHDGESGGGGSGWVRLLVFSGYPQAITKNLCALFKRMPKLLRVPPTAFCS